MINAHMTKFGCGVAMAIGVLCATAFLTGGAQPALAASEGWLAGMATEDITPREPIVLLGYPDRKGTFTSVASPLYAKALALKDADGRVGVIVTIDLVGVQTATTTNTVYERIREKTGLRRDQIVFSTSHTHTAPVVSLHPNLTYNVSHPAMTEADAKRTVAYSRDLHDKLVSVVVRALGKFSPARLSWGKGTVGFVMSRRMPTPKGVVMQANPKGLADQTVPVLRIEGSDGKLRGVVFGCACHNVAAGTVNQVSGDYAGFAQAAVEEKYPGAQAMFMTGCGGDANPHPLGNIDLAKSHGRELAAEVSQVLKRSMTAIDPELRTSFAEVEFPLQQLSREEIVAYLPLPNFQARTARQMLEVLDKGQKLPTSFRAPIAVWRLGTLRLVVLPGEPVAEYVSLIGERLGPDPLWIAGFSNEVFGYLPTAKVVKEGGHEAIGITLWSREQSLFSQVGFFAPQVEDVVVSTVGKLADRVEAQHAKAPGR